MNKKITSEIINNSEYLSVLLYIFLHQEKKETYISRIACDVFQQRNALDITKTAEYIKSFRILKALEKNKLIKKKKPAKKEKGKTHYTIDLENFTKFILKYLRSLPTISGQVEDLFKKINYNQLSRIEIFLGITYMGIAFDYISFILADRENKLAMKGFNLRDSLLIVVDKFKFFKEKKDKAGQDTQHYLRGISKIKNIDKRNLYIFLCILKLLKTQFTPHAYIEGHLIDLNEYASLVLFDDKEGWRVNDFKRILKNKQEVFRFSPID